MDVLSPASGGVLRRARTLPLRCALAAVLLAAAPGLGGPDADGSEGSEQRRATAIRVALIFRFADHVEWPEEAFAGPETRMRFCAVGEDTLDRGLEVLAGRHCKSREVEVVHFPSVRELTFCHVLYVSPSERPRQRQLLDALATSPVLTVGDTKDFAESGGMLELVEKVNGLAFEVNPGAAKAAGLVVEPSLIRLAERTVETKSPR